MTEAIEPNSQISRKSDLLISSSPVLMAVARILIALIFVLSGISKLGTLQDTQAYMQAMGVPPILLWPAAVFEITAGALIMLGYQTRPSAVLLAGYTLLTAAIFHHNFGDQTQIVMFLKNISMAGGLFLLAVVGAGSISFDKRA